MLNNDVNQLGPHSKIFDSRNSIFRAAGRAASFGVVVAGLIASVATSPAYSFITESKEIPSFSLGGDGVASTLVVVEVSPETFAEVGTGGLATLVTVSLPCAADGDNECSDISSDVSVELTIVEINDEGIAINAAKYASLSSASTSATLQLDTRSATASTRTAKVAFEARRSDGIDVDISLSALVDVTYSINSDTEFPAGSAVGIEFEPIPSGFVFPKPPTFDDDDAGVTEGDGGVVVEGDGGVVDAG